MSKLKCTEKECKHNQFCLCNKQCIVLDDDAVCCSYQKRQIEDANVEFAAEDLTTADIETTISCNDLSCFFNKECRCRASDVKIDCDAWCETYRRK